jgi:single-stranded-DNA-specific exonuclease
MAAGLKIKLKNIERFKTNFDNAVATGIKPSDLTPKLSIDCELGFDDISDRLINEIESLTPFGNGNPEPLFIALRWNRWNGQKKVQIIVEEI